MAKRDREINIFNIAFLDVITGAMGAFVLLVILLSPYYTGADPKTLKRQEAAQAAIDQAKQELKQAQQAAQKGGNDEEVKKALAKAQADLDEARKELDGLKQQLDQLSAQNKRLTDLDDKEQKELQDAQKRIADLERQVAQSSKEALDRAEQNMRQADQAIQSGNVEDLRRLLAQARADLAEARKQLDSLQQALAATQQELAQAQNENAALQAQLSAANAAIEDLRKKLQDTQAALAEARRQIEALNAKLNQALTQLQQMQQALAQAQQERDRALVQMQQMQQALAQAQQQRDQALAERERAIKTASAMKQTLDRSGPEPVRWVIITASATPACDKVEFKPDYLPLPLDGVPAFPGFATPKEVFAYLERGIYRAFFDPFGNPESFSSARPFHRQFLVAIPIAEMRMLAGFEAASPPPAGCQMSADFAMTTYSKGRIQGQNWRVGVRPFVDTRPVLFSAIPPAENSVPSKEDAATWNKTYSAAPASAQSGGAKP